MERFLRYSVEHERSIRAVFLWEGRMVQKTVTVLAMAGDSVTLRVGRKGKPMILAVSDLFSCDYARGDHGEE